MKNSNNNIFITYKFSDPIKKDMFDFHYRHASLRLRLADEIFNTRDRKGLTQQALAKNIHSTQKVISRIENGDVNVGIEMFDRLSEELNFTTENLTRIFSHIEDKRKVELSLPTKQFVQKTTIFNFLSDNIGSSFGFSPSFNRV